MSTKTQETGIRPYGPGKFATMLDAHVYELSLDGTDEETGDVDTTGWYGLLTGPFETSDELTAEENTELLKTVGVIVSADSQGFVDVQYFDLKSDLTMTWLAINDEIDAEQESEETR